MSSLVVFPFNSERPEVVIDNIAAAARHPRVGEVQCVAFAEEETYAAVTKAIPGIAAETGTPVGVMLQQRIGNRRPGKGDGMNTALRSFQSTEHSRLHFYDADITSFDGSWITKAEDAADLGYDCVRHYFPRASTDAMITWMVTRTGFTLLFPHSDLPWIEQPLGGEMLLTREAVDGLVADPLVADRSDWGIDTMLSFSIIRDRVPTFESYVPQGKIHKLYGGLTDLRTMVVECFAAVRDLRGERIESGTVHHVEHPLAVPSSVKERLAYDIEATLDLIGREWTDRQSELLDLFPAEVAAGALAARDRISVTFLDDDRWYDTYRVLLEHFDESDPDWVALLFRLWTIRVLAYTLTSVVLGYDAAIGALRRMLRGYLQRAAVEG